jgi:hypothetical protein
MGLKIFACPKGLGISLKVVNLYRLKDMLEEDDIRYLLKISSACKTQEKIFCPGRGERITFSCSSGAKNRII